MNSYAVAERINAEINHSVSYMTDFEQYGIPEMWRLARPGGYEDCDGYMLTKWRSLLDKGWPAEKLVLALCWVETGEYHAVLVAETDQGVFALDNRHPSPMVPSKLPYRWDKGLRGTEWHELSFS